MRGYHCGLVDEPGRLGEASESQPKGGVHELNEALQRVLNPARPGEPAVERFGWRFQMRDKVIQTENDYDKDVFNGDVGIVERVDPVEQQVAVRF